MPNIVDQEEEEGWRRSFSLSPSPSGSPIVFCPLRSSFSYRRLPVHLDKLTIIKLDASSFDVHVAWTASVRELKIAVEDVFRQSKKDRPRETISWVHVWSHFCLSYRGLKLIEEKALLKNFGIKDGDQLHFIRHLSIRYTPLKHRQRLHPAKTELRRKSWSGPEHLDLEFEDSTSDKIRNGALTTVVDDEEDEHLVVIDRQSPFKLTQYLKGCLCYSVPKDACRRARYESRDP